MNYLKILTDKNNRELEAIFPSRICGQFVVTTILAFDKSGWILDPRIVSPYCKELRIWKGADQDYILSMVDDNNLDSATGVQAELCDANEVQEAWDSIGGR